MNDQQRTEAMMTALRQIALSVTTARRRASSMGVLPAGAGENLMCDVEHALTSLIVLGVVAPIAPETPRRTIGGST